MPNLPRAVVLEGFTFIKKPQGEPIEKGVFYLWVNHINFNRSENIFQLVKKIDDTHIELNKYNSKYEPLIFFNNKILYKLEYASIPDDDHPETQMKFNGNTGRLFKLQANKNILDAYGHIQTSIVSRHRSRSRSRGRSRGGNKKTKKHRKNK